MFKLTAKEEEVMEHIWTLGTCAPKDVVALYSDDERPHINSVANAFQSLEKKGYLTHRQRGRGATRVQTAQIAVRACLPVYSPFSRPLEDSKSRRVQMT